MLFKSILVALYLTNKIFYNIIKNIIGKNYFILDHHVASLRGIYINIHHKCIFANNDNNKPTVYGADSCMRPFLLGILKVPGHFICPSIRLARIRVQEGHKYPENLVLRCLLPISFFGVV